MSEINEKELSKVLEKLLRPSDEELLKDVEKYSTPLELRPGNEVKRKWNESGGIDLTLSPYWEHRRQEAIRAWNTWGQRDRHDAVREYKERVQLLKENQKLREALLEHGLKCLDVIPEDSTTRKLEAQVEELQDQLLEANLKNVKI